MAAKIKLQRRGTKNKPFYRVVIQDESAPSNGRVVEILGEYNTMVDPSKFEVDAERTKYWLSQGAQPTDRLRILLGKAGLMPPVDLAALPKRKTKGEAPAEEAKPEAKPEVKPEAKAEEKAAEEPK